MSARETLQQLLAEKILIIDGAMGTMIQGYQLNEADYRGDRFSDWGQDLKGNNDVLSLTRPHIIKDIHLAYLQAGADIIETNTFSGTRIAQGDYGLEAYVYELNKASAALAKEAIATYLDGRPDSGPKFVAGAIGPTNRTLSLSPDVNDPGYRAVTFDEVSDAYYEQVAGLIEGGADLLLIETIFDTLNAKAALYAIEKYKSEKGIDIPVMISGTITDASGRTLSGQTLSAFCISVSHADPISIGLNCALGGDQMRPYIEELARLSPTYISCYPNAGLPNAMGEYDEGPEQTASIVAGFARNGWLNLVGGCCGTTPEHIEAIAKAVRSLPPRPLPLKESLL